LNYSYERRELDAYFVIDGSKYMSSSSDVPQKVIGDILKLQDQGLKDSNCRHKFDDRFEGQFLRNNVVLLDNFNVNAKPFCDLVELLGGIQPAKFKIIITSVDRPISPHFTQVLFYFL
jgi:hypothetical protein